MGKETAVATQLFAAKGQSAPRDCLSTHRTGRHTGHEPVGPSTGLRDFGRRAICVYRPTSAVRGQSDAAFCGGLGGSMAFRATGSNSFSVCMVALALVVGCSKPDDQKATPS